MHRLISLSPAVAEAIDGMTDGRLSGWFCGHDPVDRRIGSGGGTVHLLREAWKASGSESEFATWVKSVSGLILHAGGQSRRLPAYAAEGKAMIPVPVYRWSLGQRIDQTLLDLQAPVLERLLSAGGDAPRWLVASGDVLVTSDRLPSQLPDADVVCIGVWGEPEQATRHGVFFTPRSNTSELAFMLQKPDLDAIRQHSHDHYFLLDVGIWLLSPRAVRVLLGKSMDGDQVKDFDLYGEFGPSLGTSPHRKDDTVNPLTAAVVPLEDGQFYHFGNGVDLIGSCLRLQNKVIDQRRLSTVNIKPHPSMFVQNTRLGKTVLASGQANIWIENSAVPDGWQLDGDNIVTGIPENDWSIHLPTGTCMDAVPLKSGCTAWRVYGIKDAFRGEAGDNTTRYCGDSLLNWMEKRGLSLAALGIDPREDIQCAAIFPVFKELPEEGFIQWLIDGQGDAFRESYLRAGRVSAEEIGSAADLAKIRGQRQSHLLDALPVLFKHAERSVAYQVDLEDLAGKFSKTEFQLPQKRPDPQRDLFASIRDSMFRSKLNQLRGTGYEEDERRAFGTLASTMVESARRRPVKPDLNCLDDQIIWGRSPARLDLAGGWADTPPYCFIKGGRVVNVAVELNGQPPIQVFIRKRKENGIRIRSIDLGIAEEIASYDDLRSYAQLGSGFAVPKAALALAGFLPEFHQGKCPHDLHRLLAEFGTGFEMSLLCAIPKGSGLGTSSILAATIFGVLNEFCQLGWDDYAIAERVLVLEQMLTSGGGWQDQYGGICRGLKFLETQPGLDQTPRIHWIDDHLLTDPVHQPNILLYYTGITRVAKSVLGEIVRGMFLNSHHRLGILDAISSHAAHTREVLQAGDYAALAAAVAESWRLNQSLDPGTNPPDVQALLGRIEHWIGGCKLLGAGGGGYLLILARDGDAAQRIKRELTDHPPNQRARFVSIGVSRTGLQVTRS